jgi:hypothetical protein
MVNFAIEQRVVGSRAEGEKRQRRLVSGLKDKVANLSLASTVNLMVFKFLSSFENRNLKF